MAKQFLVENVLSFSYLQAKVRGHHTVLQKTFDITKFKVHSRNIIEDIVTNQSFCRHIDLSSIRYRLYSYERKSTISEFISSNEVM